MRCPKGLRSMGSNDNLFIQLEAPQGQLMNICIFCIYLFASRLQLQKDAKNENCRKKWRGGLKETIKLMLIRPPQLQFFEDGIKITATDTKYYQVEN